MERETGGPAFPVPIAGDTAGFVDAEECGVATGMTLRDYFAAKCMPAVIGSLNGPVTGEEYPGDFDYYASAAYKMADAMLAARAK